MRDILRSKFLFRTNESEGSAMAAFNFFDEDKRGHPVK
jgi:hypothetical protein